MSQPLVVTEAAEPSVVRITLNRPEKRNALSVALMDELRDAVRVAAGDPRCRVLILRGNGPCSARDWTFKKRRSLAARNDRPVRWRAYEAICLSQLVTIAAAQGAAMGGGVGSWRRATSWWRRTICASVSPKSAADWSPRW
jgi:enoyl-CoA hydratase/carnithine racemase